MAAVEAQTQASTSDQLPQHVSFGSPSRTVGSSTTSTTHSFQKYAKWVLLAVITIAAVVGGLVGIVWSATKKDDNDSPIGMKCFSTTEELRDAVNKYTQAGSELALIRKTYGSSIRYWCVGDLTDFSQIFYKKEFFNEPLDGWNLSNAVTTNAMFREARRYNQDLSM